MMAAARSATHRRAFPRRSAAGAIAYRAGRPVVAVELLARGGRRLSWRLTVPRANIVRPAPHTVRPSIFVDGHGQHPVRELQKHSFFDLGEAKMCASYLRSPESAVGTCSEGSRRGGSRRASCVVPPRPRSSSRASSAQRQRGRAASLGTDTGQRTEDERWQGARDVRKEETCKCVRARRPPCGS